MSNSGDFTTRESFCGILQHQVERVADSLRAGRVVSRVSHTAQRANDIIAQAHTIDGRVEFRGLTGSHSVSADGNGERIQAHWDGFCAANEAKAMPGKPEGEHQKLGVPF